MNKPKPISMQYYDVFQLQEYMQKKHPDNWSKTQGRCWLLKHLLEMFDWLSNDSYIHLTEDDYSELSDKGKQAHILLHQEFGQELTIHVWW